MTTSHVTKRTICAINQLSIEMTGGVVADPRNNFRQGQGLGFVDRIVANEAFGHMLYEDVFHQAAAYLFYIVKNHVFEDGNKRTGLATAVLFLELNGIALAPFNENAVFDRISNIAAGTQDAGAAIPEMARWLRRNSLY
ncbi:MAG: type II toxin-antitoxin system death-on-curing family toxin [Candidatus Fermentibacteraceae bacterium]